MVDYRSDGGVAILEVNNPPVNALSHHVRVKLRAGIQRANDDPGVSSVVIYGVKQFLAGADIKEFSTGASTHDPALPQLCDIIEGSDKPVVCGIEGYAFGGGLEVAISSHYRVARTNCKFGFPEVDLGLLPGATGTQRFPRLAGLQFALEVVPSGKTFNALTALKRGVIDKIVEQDVLKAALEYARQISHESVDGRRTSKMVVKDSNKAEQLRAAAVATVNRRQPGLMAPLFAINSVMASINNTFDKGCAIERDLFVILATSGQAQALQYAFFAQRKATQWALSDGSTAKNTKGQPVRSVAVIGGGTMGSGIAMAVLNVGLPVVLLEQNKQAVNLSRGPIFLGPVFLPNTDAGVRTLTNLYKESVGRGLVSAGDAEKLLSRLKPTLSYKDIGDVDLVIEAVYENTRVKQNVFIKMDEVCKPGAILCTNTSALSIDEIASVTRRPGSVMGMHFFVPSYYMKILENVRGKDTTPLTIATATEFAHRIGKIPVLVGNCYGFVANRAMKPRALESQFLLEEGCSCDEVDRVAEDYGFPMGPLKVADLSGLDIGGRQIEERAEKLGVRIDEKTRLFDGERFSPLLPILVGHKRLGRKAGAGWYDYDRLGAKVARRSDFVMDLLQRFRRDLGIQSRKIPTQEIEERLTYSVINECFKILEEGIANKPEEIDTILLLGYGWPKQTGGPMYSANVIGLRHVYSRILHYSQEHATSKHWRPSALLKSLADQNVPISEWHAHAATSTRPSTTSRL